MAPAKVFDHKQLLRDKTDSLMFVTVMMDTTYKTHDAVQLQRDTQ